MKRKIYNELVRWKQERQGKTAVMIDGARRIGKSYIAEEFAKNEYKSYILVIIWNILATDFSTFPVTSPKSPMIFLILVLF